MSTPSRQIIGPKPDVLEVEISKARTEDVAAVRSLLLEHFGYIYLTLFGPSYEQASTTLDSILKANSGRHQLGFESFYVARSKDNTKITHGILRLKTKTSNKKWAFLGEHLVLKVVLRNLGLRGTFHALRKWFAIRAINAKVEADELHIVYLAVSDVAKGRSVGKQLLNFAKIVALSERKRTLSLYVREKNVNARNFFLNQGFSIDDTIVNTEADNLLMQGATIRLFITVPPADD